MRAYFLTRPGRLWIALFAVAAVVAFAAMPKGFFGGASDDWQYLNASRCWAAHGPCLPTDHWQGRWPAIVPTAALISVFGESRLTIAVWPMLSSAVALGLVIALGNKLAGAPAGWVAGILILFIPTFGAKVMSPSIESLELSFLAAGALCIAHWTRARAGAWAALAGLAFGMAFQVRETALIGAGIAFAFILAQRPRPADLLPAIAGFAAPLVVELLVYWVATGDPLYRRELSVAHTRVPSSELLGPIDSKHPPFFNPAYIANWRREPGIHVHWLVDGPLNLLLNAAAGWSLLFSFFLLTIRRRQFSQAPRRLASALFIAAACYVCALNYGLAVDPKPRIMLVPLVMSSLALSVLLISLWRDGDRALARFLTAAHILSGLLVLFSQPQVYGVEDDAASWIEQYPDRLEADQATRRNLALVPGVSRISGLNRNRPLLIHVSENGCRNWPARAGLHQGDARLLHALPMSRLGSILPRGGSELCLFQLSHGMTGNDVGKAIRRSD